VIAALDIAFFLLIDFDLFKEETLLCDEAIERLSSISLGDS
jgi:hypothetical protein